MPPQHHIGTSGWTYDDWQGAVYPRGVTGVKRLAHYATLFDTVEVNATFYRFLSATMIAAWNRQLPRGFRLVVKGSRRITHVKDMPKPELVQLFLQRVAQLQHSCVVLWQMPPHKTLDVAYLERFISCIKHHSPSQLRHAIEFRHASWWTPKTYAALRAAQMAFVCISHPELPQTFVQTTDVTYVRLHGRDAQDKYYYNYSPRELAVWARRLKSLDNDAQSYVLFNNDKAAHAVANAQKLMQQLGQRP